MMHAVMFAFNADATSEQSHEEIDEAHKVFLAEKMLPYLLKSDLEYSCIRNWASPDSSSWLERRYIVKCFWDYESRGIKDLLAGVSGVAIEEFPVCLIPGCYDPTAEKQAKGLHGVLFDRYGEEPHEIHQQCWQHCHVTSRAIMRTIETVDETSGKEFWTRILVWSLRKRWYAQRLDQYQDGDYETGEISCLEGSAWTGPHATREAAIESARAME